MSSDDIKKKYQTIIDRETLMKKGAEGCLACGKPFTLGDPVVLACGAWDGPPRLIHENEAIFDPHHAFYFERKYHNAGNIRRC